MPQQIINNSETGLVVRTKLNANFTELYGKTNDLFNDITALEVRVTAAEGAIVSLDGRVDVNELDIDALQLLTAQHTADISALDARVTNTEADIAVLQPLVTQHGIDIADIYATAAFTDQAYADPAWITSLSSNKLVGQIPLALIPPSAVERAYVYGGPAILPWLAGLTTGQVQSGDTVIMTTDNNKMYVIVDDTQLNNPTGFQVYTAGAASSVPFTGITGLPTTLAGYGITDAWHTSGLTSIASATIQGNVGKTDNLTFDRLNAFQVTDTKSFIGSVNDLFRYSLVGPTDRSVKLDATEWEVTYEAAGGTSKITVSDTVLEFSNLVGVTLSKINIAGGLDPTITYTAPKQKFSGAVYWITAPAVDNALTSILTRDPVSGEIKTKTIASIITGTVNRLSKFTSANGLGDSSISDTGTAVFLNVAPANDNALIQLLTRDTATGEVKYRTAASLLNGTVNRIARFTSANTVTDSSIFDNGTNVGIGTVTPTQTLSINSATQAVIDLKIADVSKVFIGAVGLVDGLITGSVVGDLAVRSIAGRILFSANNGVGSNLTILPSGNVGLGTNNPAAALHIASASATSSIRLEKSGTSYELANNGNDFYFLHLPSGQLRLVLSATGIFTFNAYGGSGTTTATLSSTGVLGRSAAVTNAIVGAIRVAGGGGALNADDTYDGYTLPQIVSALKTILQLN